jgi:hypothetical protein
MLGSAIGSALVGFIQPGAGAVRRNAQDKMREWVSAKDFGATGDGTTDDTTAIEAALTYLKTVGVGGGTLFLPSGTYITTRALQLNGGITVQGASLRTTSIVRTNTVAETIDAQSFTTIFYVTGGWNHISDLSMTGVNGSVDGIIFGVNIAAKCSYKNLAINSCNYGIREIAGIFLSVFENIQAVSCNFGFTFNSATEKTSLVFKSCYAANCGYPYDFKLARYSEMSACAADNCNWNDKPANPYGTGFGSYTTEKGIYHFDQCGMTLTNIGAEGSYGNGLVSFANSSIVANGCYATSCGSEFVPNYAAYSTYGVGPFQSTTAGGTITINSPEGLDWTNSVVVASYPTKPRATVVAYNYDEASLGVLNYTLVTVNSAGIADASMFAGYGPIGRNCVSVNSSNKGPSFSAYASAAQALTTDVFTKVQCNTEEWDSRSAYDAATNYRFTPLVSAYYNLIGGVEVSGTVSRTIIAIYKNGSEIKRGNGGAFGGTVAAKVYLDSDDYVELYVRATGSSLSTEAGLAQLTYFQGSLARTA